MKLDAYEKLKEMFEEEWKKSTPINEQNLKQFADTKNS
jgi:hypothetical protein